MKDCKISDDGKVTGTYEEVLAYEKGLKNPLSRLGFPYSREFSDRLARYPHRVHRLGEDKVIDQSEMDILIAFANLAPLIAEWAEACKWEQMHPQMPGNRNLWEGYKAAVALIPGSK